MNDNKDFLGTGWSFPPDFDKDRGKVNTTSGEEDIRKSLEILVNTRLGERVMLPTYGCNLEELLFAPLNRTIKTYIGELIRNAILYHEPRVDVEKINLSETQELDGKVLIEIQYRTRATNARQNMVFPFYKEEGTNL